ncbi:DUF2852 domain-containing protein [Rhodobacteraceae bacterium RKSG542]|uniref:DUF2852 domain-containing protein n=1 Tax=Pseudovibrio flavus TaxID=2529854 RepID=UPI0012BCB07A|nr:DUF2852 domain-containing protein [Pseudovibrio flavus]MTI18524.1 DUF2852 domain-containing protein [Pseudovibrio flavus]
MALSNTIRPEWNPVMIGLMILGFIIAWPLGLLVIAYIIWGDQFPAFKQDVKRCWKDSPFSESTTYTRSGRTGNAAFDDYREQELERLEEERKKLDAMREDFDKYMKELRRARDKEEFDRFMAARKGRPAGHPSEAEGFSG